MKHCLSCLIYYMKTCTFLRTTKCKSSLEKIIMYGPNLIYYMYVPLSVILKTFEVSFSSSNSSFKVLYSCILFAQEIRQILMKLSWEQLARRRSPPSAEKKNLLEPSSHTLVQLCDLYCTVFILSCFKVLKKKTVINLTV